MTVATTGASAEDVVTFDSAQYLVGNLQQRKAREHGEPIRRSAAEKITGYLSRPAGSGRFPAIVFLHGCDGLTDHVRAAAGQFAATGVYVTLVTDSFATRGIKDACLPTQMVDRHADAVGALIYLTKLPFVDPDRIAVIGYAQGGFVALLVASTPPSELFVVPDRLKYKAAIAYYPLCGAAADELSTPALIFVGALDWLSAVECKLFMKRWSGTGAPVTLTTFDRVHHSFDDPKASGSNPLYGYWYRYNAEAAARAAAASQDFLTTQLAK